LANRGRASFNKRRKENERRQRQQKKVERRAERRAEVRNGPAGVSSEERDLAGIVPGPQPPREDEY
jgi:hypothetical protein